MNISLRSDQNIVKSGLNRVVSLVFLGLRVAMALGIAAPAHAGLVGNDLGPRAGGGDGANTIFYTNFVPMPMDGTVDSVSIYNQGKDGSFRLLQLRPQNADTEFTIIYDSGALTPNTALPEDSIEVFSLASPVPVQEGDWFAHYGNGIPYTTGGPGNPQNIYYSVSTASVDNAIAGVTPIKVDGSTTGFPKFSSARDYAWAVNMPEYIPPDVTDITPTYVADENYNRLVYTGSGTPAQNDGRHNFDVGTNQQYMWFDYSDALADIPCFDRLLSAELSWTGTVYNDYVGTPLVESDIGVFAVPDDNKGIDSICTGGSGVIPAYYADHLTDLVDAVTATPGATYTVPLDAQWDITSLMQYWFDHPGDPLRGQLLLLQSATPMNVAWSSSGAGGPTLIVTTIIPEPSTLILVGLGGIGLLVGYPRRRRRR